MMMTISSLAKYS